MFIRQSGELVERVGKCRQWLGNGEQEEIFSNKG